MPLLKDDDSGIWTLELDESEDDQQIIEQSHPSYIEAIPKFLNDFDPLFSNAKNGSDVYFIWALLGIKGFQSPGWDP